MQDATLLPKDLAACHALLVEQSTALVELQVAREQLSLENQELNLAIQKLLARLYGQRSERHIDPNQLQIDFGKDPAVQDGLADAAAEAEKIVQEYTVRRTLGKKKPRSEEFPEHLARYEVLAEVPEAEQQCAQHGQRQMIGYDTTQTLEFQRPKLRVRVTKYPKFACAADPTCGVVEPPRPASLVEGNRYDTSIAAEIVTAKYAYHMPTYRQQDWFAGSGWMPGRSTLLNIMASAAYVLEPLYLHYADQVRTSPVIPTDETGVMLLLPADIPAARAGDPKSQRIHEVLARRGQRTSRTSRPGCGSIAAWEPKGPTCSISPCPAIAMARKTFCELTVAPCWATVIRASIRSRYRVTAVLCGPPAMRMRGGTSMKAQNITRAKQRNCWPGIGSCTTWKTEPGANIRMTCWRWGSKKACRS